MMKKVIAVAMLIMIALTMTSCGKTDDSGKHLLSEAARETTTIVDLLQYLLDHYEVHPSQITDVSHGFLPSDSVGIHFMCDDSMVVFAGNNKKGLYVAYVYSYNDHYPLELLRLLVGMYDWFGQYAGENEKFSISFALKDLTYSVENSESAAKLLNILNEYYSETASTGQ